MTMNTTSTNTRITRIRNPVTGTYYRLRVRSTPAGNRGTIMGKWSPPKPATKRGG